MSIYYCIFSPKFIYYYYSCLISSLFTKVLFHLKKVKRPLSIGPRVKSSLELLVCNLLAQSTLSCMILPRVMWLIWDSVDPGLGVPSMYGGLFVQP